MNYLVDRRHGGSSFSKSSNRISFNMSKDARKGVLISYACERDEMAYDSRDNEHGLYTGHVLSVHINIL